MSAERLIIGLDMGRILPAIGIDARRRGEEWRARCPMHYERVGKLDRKPSWSINENNGLSNCFSCGYASDLLGLVIDVTDMGLWEASRWLRAEGMETLDLALREGHIDTEPLANLTVVPTVQEAWLMFGAPPKSARAERLVTKGACAHFDVRWTDSWCLPIKTWRGELLGHQYKRGKSVRNHPDEVPKSSTLFGIDVMPPGERVILLESPLDCLRLWDSGYDGALAAFGVYASSDQLELIRTFTDRLIVALDNDSNGRQQSRRLYERLRHSIRDIRFIDYSQTTKRKATGRRPKDVGEMTDEEIHLSLRHSRTISEAISIGIVPAELQKEYEDVRQHAGVRGPKKGVKGARQPRVQINRGRHLRRKPPRRRTL